MVKKSYEFMITHAPVTNTVSCAVPEEIHNAALEQGIDLLAFVDKLNGSMQLGAIVDGERVLVLVTVTSEKEPIQKDEDLRQEVQKMMFL